MKNIIAGFLIVALVASANAQPSPYQPPEGAAQALGAISEQSIMAHIRVLASDEFEGRAPGTRGDRLTQNYIAAQMELLGLKPGGDGGTYFQRVPILAQRTDAAARLKVSGKGGQLEFPFGSEFVAFTGTQEPETRLENAELVFVGYGIEAPEQQWDDYKGADLKGKVLLMMNNDPSTDDPNFFAGKTRTYYGRWTYKYEIAARKGAAGALVIHTTESAGYGWNVVESSWGGDRFELAIKAGTPTTKVKGWTTLETTKKILGLAGKSLDKLLADAEKKSFRPVPLGVTVGLTLNTSQRSVETANIIGVLHGTDRSDEAVILTAHHDHFGIGKPVNGDSIYNGALDNASGVSGLLNVAKMFTNLPAMPRRSIVFATVAAEESGLIGSQYYAQNPTFPPAKIAANINIDGLNTFGRTKDIIMIGYGKSSLDDILRGVASWQNRILKPDQSPEKGLFYRSDQFNFAKIGVPCMFLKSGLEHADHAEGFGKQKDEEYTRLRYHQPADEISEDWHLAGAVEDMQLTFLVALDIANAAKGPSWRKGDEFEGIRLKSLKN